MRVHPYNNTGSIFRKEVGKMKVVQINSVYGVGSTGRIAMDLQNYMNQVGIEVRTIYGYGSGNYPDTLKMQNMAELKANIALGRITGRHGYYNQLPTRGAILYLEKEKPDIVHFHNIHGYFINVPMLMRYVKENRIPVVWTFHDCWPFTGHCCYFDDYRCEKWKEGCERCPAWGEYKILLGDRSRKNWEEKRTLFSGLEKCVLVSPSQWLADFFPHSFLKQYPAKVIHNGIDTQVFRPTKNSVKKELGIEGRKMVLGIVPDLEGPKGGKYLVELAKRLGEEYAVVLLSLQCKEKLPANVYVLPRTNNTRRLAEIYSAADVFVNPTLHDNYPTVNLEATACGTPVVTFRTGGSPEGVFDGFGEVVDQKDMDMLLEAVKKWSAQKSKDGNCVMPDTSVLGKDFFAKQYIQIYHQLMEKE